VIATTVSGNSPLSEDSVLGMDLINKHRVADDGTDNRNKAIGNVDYETRSINVSFPVSLLGDNKWKNFNLSF